MLIAIPFADTVTYERNGKRHLNDQVHEAYRCVVCYAPIKLGKAAGWVHLFYGDKLGTPDEIDRHPGADMSFYPVGSDCWRRHPEIHAFTE